MENFKNKIILITAVFLIFTLMSHAQGSPPAFDPDTADTTAGPLSGLVALGLIVGVVFGYKKLSD